MKITGIDPGPKNSGVVTIEICDGKEFKVLSGAKCANRALLEVMSYGVFDSASHSIAIEKPTTYNFRVGASVFETCVWAGRFAGVVHPNGTLLGRKEIVSHLCGTVTAGDKQVIMALVDRFEPNMRKGMYGKGTKIDKGLFYGFKADMWQALAVAIVFADKRNLWDD